MAFLNLSFKITLLPNLSFTFHIAQITALYRALIQPALFITVTSYILPLLVIAISLKNAPEHCFTI